LPNKSIDTGMGLERIASIVQGVPSNFETDGLRALVAVAEDVSGVAYGADEKTDVSLRILSDHARAMAFLISDGVLPSNEKRGYVLRRLLRRAVRHGRLLGVEETFLTTLTDVVIEQMGAAYPELVEHRELISRLVDSEERRFAATLRQGLEYLSDEIEKAKAAGSDSLDGAKAFALHDTYGFPVELTAEIVGEAGLTVERDVFDAEMEAQRERGRAAVKDDSWDQGAVAVFVDALEGSPEIEFVGYEADEADATVLAIIVEGAARQEVGEGVEAEVVLDRTPFYAEQGGQVGDVGTIDSSGTRIDVADARAPVDGVVAHHGSVASGTLRVGDAVHAAIDTRRRDRIRRNHTATHLLHWALRLVLGEHVRQSGSFVAPDRLRFDFTHFEAPADEDLARIERLVNAKIMEDHLVMAYETSLESAREAGVTALFGEKYGDFVRVLEVGNFSKELCGGTHVSRTSEIGLLRISSEGSVGANLRRIEAVTSFDAMDVVYRQDDLIARTAASLKVRPEEVPERVEALLERVRGAEKAAADLKRASTGGDVDRLIGEAVDVGYPLIVSQVEAEDAGELRDISDVVRAKNDGGAVVLAAVAAGKVLLLAAGSDAAVAAGFDAGAVIREISPHVGGGGGGKPAMAQAGGRDPSGVPKALAAARQLLGAD
jgi:alanyl-tRNA synthetase